MGAFSGFYLEIRMNKPASDTSSTSHIVPGAIWCDTDGQPIQAHGGGLIEHEGTTYWFGEDKSGPTTLNEKGTARVPFVGIACYRSKDLVRWERCGTALSSVPDDAGSPLHPAKVVERPKVIYDPIENRFVMWFKAGGANYEYMHLGVAVSEKVTGPYRLLNAAAPNGLRAGDFALVRDVDNTSYIAHPAEQFSVIIVAELTPDATAFTGRLHRCLPSPGGYEGHEAPAIFRHRDQWYMLTSRVSGWKPNPCRVCTADRLTGPWEVLGELCDPADTGDTFASQPACVWPLDPARGRFIYVGDRWNTGDLGDSRYVWLPIAWKNERPILQWVDAWTPQNNLVWS